MAKFFVKKRVDAYVDYTTVVEDEGVTNFKEAVQFAEDNEEDLNWQEEDTVEFDARMYVAVDEDGFEIEGTETELG